MKLSKLYAVFLITILLNPLSTIYCLFQSTQINKVLPEYVCNIIKDIMKSSNDTQDVLIGNMDSTTQSLTVNSIAECISPNYPIVISNMIKPLTEKNLRKAAVVVLAFGTANKARINALIHNHLLGTSFHFMAKIICIVSNSMFINERVQILRTFKNLDFFNVAVVHSNDIGHVQFESFQSIRNEVYTETNPSNSSIIFLDKLKNMDNYDYKIVMFRQYPRVVIINNRLVSPLLHFLNALVTIQNASIRIMFIRDTKLLKTYWINKMMDLTLNVGAIIDAPEPKLLTYEEDGYCVLIPVPPKVTISELIFIEPFDVLTWLFLLISIAASVAVWIMFRGRGAVDSAWLLGYGMIVMLIGQGVDFSRNNRLVLVILLQLIVVMLFVLNNAYDSVITSFMIQPIHENRLKTFDDVVASDFEIMTDHAFEFIAKETTDWKTIKSRTTIKYQNATDAVAERIKEQRYVMIIRCDMAENSLQLSDLYYLLPQKLYTKCVQLEASYLNPFIQRMQYYMDLCFQAGLMDMWKAIDGLNSIAHVNEPDEEVYLQLRDLTQVFGVLFVGYALSTVVLFVEVFFYGFLNKLKFRHLAQKLRNRIHKIAYTKKKQSKDIKYQRGALYYIIHRHQKSKRLRPKKLKVRQIFVRPRNSDE